MKKLNYLILLLIFPFISNYSQFDTKGIKELDYIVKTCNSLLDKIKSSHLVFEEIDKLSDEELYNFTVNVYNANAKHYILTQKMYHYYAKRTRYNFIYRKDKTSPPYRGINFVMLKNFILKAAKEKIGDKLPEYYFELIEIPYIWEVKVLSSLDDLFTDELKIPRKIYKCEIVFTIKTDKNYSIGDNIKVSGLANIDKLDLFKKYLIFSVISDDENGMKYSELILLRFPNTSKLPSIDETRKIIFEKDILGYKGTFNWSELKGELAKKYSGGIK